LNNLVIGLIRQTDQFDYVPEARRFFSASFAIVALATLQKPECLTPG
jgi:hypothetical protein